VNIRARGVIIEATMERVDGRKLRRWRIARHLAQRELDEMAGPSTETVNRLERAESPRGCGRAR
jgi:hypothetical protein